MVGNPILQRDSLFATLRWLIPVKLKDNVSVFAARKHSCVGLRSCYAPDRNDKRPYMRLASRIVGKQQVEGFRAMRGNCFVYRLLGGGRQRA